MPSQSFRSACDCGVALRSGDVTDTVLAKDAAVRRSCASLALLHALCLGLSLLGICVPSVCQTKSLNSVTVLTGDVVRP